MSEQAGEQSTCTLFCFLNLHVSHERQERHKNCRNQNHKTSSRSGQSGRERERDTSEIRHTACKFKQEFTKKTEDPNDWLNPFRLALQRSSRVLAVQTMLQNRNLIRIK